MQLFGLPWSTLLPLFGGMAVATAILYVLKLRRRSVPVPFAQIWDKVLRDRESSQLFSQLKRWLSFLLQLVLLAALILALGDPRRGEQASSGKNVVVLLDASLSMQATDVAPTRLEAAKAAAKRFVRGLGSDDRAVVVQMDMLPSALSTLTGEPSELESAIDRVRAVDTAADLGRALAFAEDTLQGLPNPEVVLLSDGALTLPNSAPRFPVRRIPVGVSDVNVAITEFTARRYPLDKSRVEVFLEVTNTNDTPAEVELTLLGDGNVIDRSRLQLAASERLPRFFTDISGANRRLEARIQLRGKRDALPADDRGYALMPERRRARVLVVSKGNTYLEAALLLDEYLDVTYIEPASYTPTAGRFDVVIFDNVAFALPSDASSALYLNPPAEGAPVKLGKAIEGFGFDRWNKKHPVLRFLALGDVQVARGHAFSPEKTDEVIGESDAGPILVSGSRAGHSFLTLGFDPRDSDFVLRPAWPLFILGAIDTFVAEETGYLSSYRTGTAFRIPAPSGAETAELTTPRGNTVTVPIKEGRASYFGDQAGYYRLRVSGADPSEHEFAANLADAEESRIKPRAELDIAGKKTSIAVAGTPGVRRRLWAYLLLAVVVVSCVEWWTYHRRVTV